jgi:hypothetical protein
MPLGMGAPELAGELVDGGQSAGGCGGVMELSYTMATTSWSISISKSSSTESITTA